MRLLHERHGHLRCRTPRAHAASHRRGDPRIAGRQPLPLRRLRSRDPRCAAGGRLMALEHLEKRIAIAPDGSVTAFSGKVEFGQGIRTGFAQIVADELDVPIERVRVVMGETDRVPHDFGTFGSHSTQQEAPAFRRAAAFGRAQLLARAARRLGVGTDRLDTSEGHVVSGATRISYGELVADEPLAGAIPDEVSFPPEQRRRYVGTPLPRVEARDIVTGRATYAADVPLEDMLHGAMARPPVRGATVRGVEAKAARAMPGVVAVVHDGDVVGVVADRA